MFIHEVVKDGRYFKLPNVNLIFCIDSLNKTLCTIDDNYAKPISIGKEELESDQWEIVSRQIPSPDCSFCSANKSRCCRMRKSTSCFEQLREIYHYNFEKEKQNEG